MHFIVSPLFQIRIRRWRGPISPDLYDMEQHPETSPNENNPRHRSWRLSILGIEQEKYTNQHIYDTAYDTPCRVWIAR